MFPYTERAMTLSRRTTRPWLIIGKEGSQTTIGDSGHGATSSSGSSSMPGLIDLAATLDIGGNAMRRPAGTSDGDFRWRWLHATWPMTTNWSYGTQLYRSIRSLTAWSLLWIWSSWRMKGLDGLGILSNAWWWCNAYRSWATIAYTNGTLIPERKISLAVIIILEDGALASTGQLVDKGPEWVKNLSNAWWWYLHTDPEPPLRIEWVPGQGVATSLRQYLYLSWMA